MQLTDWRQEVMQKTLCFRILDLHKAVTHLLTVVSRLGPGHTPSIDFEVLVIVKHPEIFLSVVKEYNERLYGLL